VPPLPPRPTSDAARADDFGHDARTIERFLQQMLCHPVFGRDRHLEEFVWTPTPPIRAKIKKGFLAGMKESLDLRKTSSLRDPDDFFQKEKEWAIAYGSHIKQATDCFAAVINHQSRLTNQVNIKFYKNCTKILKESFRSRIWQLY
jgi:hypothetical protein